MAKIYELIVYTSAEKNYANSILDFIESEIGTVFSHRLCYDHCVKINGNCVFKSLEMLTNNRNIKDILIVDDIVSNYALTIKNGIPIKPFYGHMDDKELIYLAKYMKNLSNESNARHKLNKDFINCLLKNAQT